MSRSLRPILAAALALFLVTACGKAEVAGLGNPSTDAQPGQMDSELPDSSPADAVDPMTGDASDPQPGDASEFPDATGADSGPHFFDADEPEDSGEISDAEENSDATPSADAQPAADAQIILDAQTGSDAAIGLDAQTSPDASQPASDAGTAPECLADSDCGFFGHCEPVSQTCVDCLADMDCPGQRICDTAHGFVCRVPCFNGQCGPLGFCEPVTNACVECTMSSQCDANQVCDPATLSCVECSTNADCALQVGEPVCNVADNECVECLSNADCPSPMECINGIGPNYCANPINRGLCEPCENDDDCGGPADLCVGYLGPTGIFDRSCAVDCANNPMACPSGFECISVRNNTAQQCRPRYEMNTPTCEATRHLGLACDATELDPGCGIDATQDARCYSANMSSLGVCTVWCLDNADCANGTACIGATPPNQEGNCL
jgi:Cys-rich repeat protein